MLTFGPFSAALTEGCTAFRKRSGEGEPGGNNDLAALVKEPHLSHLREPGQTFLERIGAVVQKIGADEGLALPIDILPTGVIGHGGDASAREGLSDGEAGFDDHRAASIPVAPKLRYRIFERRERFHGEGRPYREQDYGQEQQSPTQTAAVE